LPGVINRATTTHTVPVTVTENLQPRMYLRQEIASGSADDGTPVEVATTGPHLIISLGTFPNGRQFTINIAELSKEVLTALTKPTP
jgi:hypothetical protein